MPEHVIRAGHAGHRAARRAGAAAERGREPRRDWPAVQRAVAAILHRATGVWLAGCLER